VFMCAPVVQGYGLTETCAASVIAVPDKWEQTGTVGLPQPITTFALESVPEMNYDATATPARGELLLKGANNFQGYYKMDDKTVRAQCWRSCRGTLCACRTDAARHSSRLTPAHARRRRFWRRAAGSIPAMLRSSRQTAPSRSSTARRTSSSSARASTWLSRRSRASTKSALPSTRSGCTVRGLLAILRTCHRPPHHLARQHSSTRAVHEPTSAASVCHARRPRSKCSTCLASH
jgi:AMP-binding enzyme